LKIGGLKILRNWEKKVMKRLYWLVMILLLFLLGCGGTTAEPVIESGGSTDAAIVATAETTPLLYTEADGFSIALPANWTAVEPSAAAFAQIGGTTGQRDALTFLTEEYVQALLASGLQLYALNQDDASLNSPVPVSIQVIRRDAPTSLTLAELVNETAVQLEAILDLTSALAQSPVTLNGMEAVQLRYTLQAQTAAGGTALVHNTQYYFMQDGDLYIITVEMAQSLVDDYLAGAEMAVETFQLTAE
jgi:hypothetical protein